ncbi:13691_t:CDS:2 [Entrophospora sp. SA101]|nr:13691_t:CDS:2 [Entrophospora sp. SA101]
MGGGAAGETGGRGEEVEEEHREVGEAGRRLGEVKDVIDKVVLENVGHASTLEYGFKMPLLQRDFTKAINVFKENLENNILGKKQKTDFNILVSGGAPGIDFGNGCPLDNTDYGLSSSIMPYIKCFNIDAVFQSIAEHLESATLYFFKDMVNELATFMMNRLEAFVQIFLSGTAPQVVISAKEPSRVSFHFVECPLLSMASMIKIVDHFAESCNAEKFECGEYKWKLCRPFLYLLGDTGGLPCALDQRET